MKKMDGTICDQCRIVTNYPGTSYRGTTYQELYEDEDGNELECHFCCFTHKLKWEEENGYEN